MVCTDITLVVSDLVDTNINHFFTLEVHAVWRYVLSNGDVNNNNVVFLKSYNKGSSVHRWRKGLIECLVGGVVTDTESAEAVGACKIVSLPPFAWRSPPGISKSALSMPLVDPFTFLPEDTPSIPLVKSLAKRVKDHLKLPKSVAEIPDWTITVLVRGNSRILRDNASRRPLEDVLSECLPVELRTRLVKTSFEDMSFPEQASIMARSRVFIAAHGAGMTNLFLLPDGAHVFEVGMRRHWYCHPVCAGHLEGVIEYVDRCGGSMSPWTGYHKADYHNLAKVCGIKYDEVELDDGGPFLDENPISIVNAFVDAQQLAQRIASAIGP